MIDFIESTKYELVVIKDSIANTQDIQSKNYNKKHSTLPKYQIGDKILNP